VYDATGGVDGRVSIEGHPPARLRQPRDDRRSAGAVVAGRPAQPLHQDPGRPAGLPAIAGCLAEGISINVTLIFSLQRYDPVMDAFSKAWNKPGRPATTCP